ncbi:FimV/HubP family polar landmark protein [Ferrimonas sediminicola]|nr:FimV/HubP family polar landmark protein [Ferrimonas sediminicola]
MTGKQRVLAALLGGALSCSLSLDAVAEGISLAGPEGEVKQVTIGPTSPKDTLWRLASAHRPEGATVYQTMLALYRANPQAFSADNLNALEKGMVLTLPDSQTILAIDPAEAKRRATQDDRQWSGQASQPKAKPKGAAPQPAVVTPQPEAQTTADASRGVVDGQLTELRSQLDEQRAQSAQQVAELRAELGRSIDEMGAMLEQNELLKARLEELNDQIQVLQDALDDQQAVNRELEQQLTPPMATEPTGEVFEPVEEMEESGIWQQLWSKPWLVGIAGVVPTIFLLALIWLFLRRRSPEPEAGQSTPAEDRRPSLGEMAANPAATPESDSAGEPDLKSAIQLDPQVDDDEEPVQSLEELLQEHQSLEQPEVSLAESASAPAEPQPDDELLADMAMSELEPDIDTVMSELGVALDDTNGMVELGHDSEDVEPSLGEDEIDALLNGAGEPPSSPQEEVPEPEAVEPAPGLNLALGDGEPALTPAEAQPAEPQQEGFIDIDKLLDETGSGEPNFEPYSGLDLDIGDADLTELVGGGNGVDVDDEEGGFSAKLDLARAYIEIDDKDSAKALLKEVVEKGADPQRQEAMSLLEKM